MTLNNVAVEALGHPQSVRLGYREDTREIGVRAALDSEVGAVRLRPSLRGDGTATGSHSMFVRSFLSYHGVHLDENHTYRLNEVSPGVFALSLGEPLPKTRSPRRAAK